MCNVINMIPANIKKELAKGAVESAIKIALGITSEIVIFVGSKQIINKIEDHEEKKRLESREPLGFQTI